MGLSGLPMKVKFIVGLTFLLYGPEHQADLQGGSVGWWPKQLLFLFFFFFLSWYLLLPELSEVDCKHLRHALNTSRPLCSGTDTCLISHVLLPETPAWIYAPGNCCIYGGLIPPRFWSPILVLCPVNKFWDMTAVCCCQPLFGWRPRNKPTTSECLDHASLRGIKILNWEFVMSFLKDASFPSSHFPSLSPSLFTLSCHLFTP